MEMNQNSAFKAAIGIQILVYKKETMEIAARSARGMDTFLRSWRCTQDVNDQAVAMMRSDVKVSLTSMESRINGSGKLTKWVDCI
jgi:hypothetical protein